MSLADDGLVAVFVQKTVRCALHCLQRRHGGRSKNLEGPYQSRFAISNGKKSPNQETCLGSRGHLKVLNDAKLVLNHLGSIWYYPEPLEGPYFPNQFLGWDFFAVSFSKPALITCQDFASISAKNWTPPPCNPGSAGPYQYSDYARLSWGSVSRRFPHHFHFGGAA